MNKSEGSEEKFKEILEAYTILSDSKKRQAYDQFGSAGVSGQGVDFSEFFKGSGAHFDFEDLFNDFGFSTFDRMFKEEMRRSPRRGNDLKVDLEVSFEEAVQGAEKEVMIERTKACPHCHGKGYEKESDKVKCDACNGHGMIEKTQRTPFGMFSTRTTCRKCQGEGTLLNNPCKECKGQGLMKERKKVKVKIPEGIDNGNHLRLKGEGNSGSLGGETGDLYILVFVKPHKVFKRDENDIYIELPVSFPEAALGAEVEVPTLKGKARLIIPEGTQSETIFRLKGQGIKDLHESSVGDEFVKVIVQTPTKVSAKARKLLEEMAREDGKNVRKNFFEGLKRKFQ